MGFDSTTTSTTHTLTGLHPYYTYVCSVSAVTVGEGPEAIVTVQMPEDGMYEHCVRAV